MNQILNATHLKRALKAHTMTLSVLYDLYLSEYEQHHDDRNTFDNISELVKEVHQAFRDNDTDQVLMKTKALDPLVKALHLKMQQFDEQLKQKLPTFKFARDYMDFV